MKFAGRRRNDVHLLHVPSGAPVAKVPGRPFSKLNRRPDIDSTAVEHSCLATVTIKYVQGARASLTAFVGGNLVLPVGPSVDAWTLSFKSNRRYRPSQV